MADIVDRGTRSRMMSGIRGKNTKPELRVRRFLHARGYRYRLHVRDLPGRPDIVLPRYHIAIQVHGCFWHRHQDCKYAYNPRSRRRFWNRKFSENVVRDEATDAALGELGWKLITVWECETGSEKALRVALRRLLRRSKTAP